MYHVAMLVDADTDRAREQVDYVCGLPCAADEVRVTAGHAVTEEQGDTGVQTGVGRVADPDSSASSDSGEARSLSRFGGVLEDGVAEVERTELRSPPADGVLEVAADEDVDEIVVAGRKRSPARKAVLGSVAQSVVLNADRPVTVVSGPG
ncbi:MAG: universal stress protein [Halobacteriaceae archaeon]